eukprot:328479-Pleurochrysis_carterae.AAC.1
MQEVDAESAAAKRAIPSTECELRGHNQLNANSEDIRAFKPRLVCVAAWSPACESIKSKSHGQKPCEEK